jgi:hypothetical protein
MSGTGIRRQGRGLKGAVNRLLARNLETILGFPGRKLYRAYERAAKDAAAVQAALLAEIVGRNADTAFGREHGFDRIRDYDDYRRAVPWRDYEGHRPWVERHAAGEEDVLFPGKPMMYTRSSGTTARPKLIPVTRYHFERAIRDRGKLWLYGLMRSYPGIYRGRSYSVVSPAEEGRTADGTPFGSLSGVMRQNIPDFMHLTHAAPWETTLIPDYESRTYCQLRFGVPADVTVVLTGNPATVLNFATRADAWKERLIRDVRDGTLDPGLDLDPATRALLEARLEPAPGRAAELERAVAAAGGVLRPVDFWPRLGLVHTWTQGNCALMLPKIRPWIGDETPILDFGYIASEVMAADLVDPATQGSLLQVQHAFYEFAPFEDGGEPGPHDRLLLAHELEEGRRYYVFVTTHSGLHRYDMNDVLEVCGRFHDAPVVRFLFKGKGVTSLQGEKLSEQQLIEAVKLGAARTGIGHDFFVAHADAGRGGYTLYVELTGGASVADRERLAAEVDRALGEVNVEYEAKRASDRLKPLDVVPLGRDSFAEYRKLRLAEGAHEGQLKWLHLSDGELTRERMQRLVAEEG